MSRKDALCMLCVYWKDIHYINIEANKTHTQNVIFLLQSVIRVIHTPNAKLPFMFRCYVWYFCYGLILTIYHESIWSQIFVLWKSRLLATNISQRVACARVVTHTHCQSNLSLPMQFTCCGLTPCITFTDFIV